VIVPFDTGWHWGINMAAELRRVEKVPPEVARQMAKDLSRGIKRAEAAANAARRERA